MMGSRYFFCYDRELRDFLTKQGFRDITKALHPKTMRVFWLFERTPSLTAALDEYNQ